VPANDRQPVLLFVEDDRDTLVAAARLFEALGFVVLPATGGDTAFDRAKTEMPDVIVADVVMPRSSGVTLCERLHASVETRDIPVLIYTGLTDTAVLADLHRLGVQVFAIKPCGPTVVAEHARLLAFERRVQNPPLVITGDGELMRDLAYAVRARCVEA
jgi:CheY-like chemotaxis protein